VKLRTNLTIGSGVTVNDIKIDLNTFNLTIEGKASKLIVKDTAGAVEQVTVAAGASVTDSTITLSNDFNAAANQGDQLIVKGILKDSTVIADAAAAEAAIIKLAKTLDGVTFSCQIKSTTTTTGVCIEATAASAQIINSTVNFDVAAVLGATPKVVNAGTNGVTIIRSVLKQIAAGSGTAVTVVNHGGGTLVVQNSTINLNGNTNDNSRAVNSTAASGSIILTGNVFEGYNNANNKPVVDIGGALGGAPQQIVNNQFRITNPATIGIRSVGASSELRELYASSGNTFGVARTKVTSQ
jgi:antitoxin component of MazEF toxin-antitoxin module